MINKRKPWNDGGSLYIAYEGDKDGSATFSSDAYEGIDRTQNIVFRSNDNTIITKRTIKQEGTRQQFVFSDGKVFNVAQGRFGVLKTK